MKANQIFGDSTLKIESELHLRFESRRNFDPREPELMPAKPMSRPSEWTLRMDVPLGVKELLDEDLERSPAGEPGMRSVENKAYALSSASPASCRSSRDSIGTGSR